MLGTARNEWRMVFDGASPEHPYLQLAARLRERIQAGEAGEIVSRLPSLTELTGHTGPAMGTVRRAIDVLARERLGAGSAGPGLS